MHDAQNDIAWPAVFLVGADGRVRWRHLTEDYRVRPLPQVLLAALGPAR